MTNTSGALRMARTEVLTREAGDRESVPDVVILITDGRPNIEYRRYDDEVLKLKQVRNRNPPISSVSYLTGLY